MKKMNCLIYTRVSSSDQVQNFSLDSQEEINRRIAQERGYTVDQVFREEGVSGKNTNRPQLIALLEYCRKNKRKIAAVMVYKWDRLCRNTQDHLAIKAKLAEYGIKLESATEPNDNSPAGVFVETMLASVAQMNNEISSERIRAGVQKRFFEGYGTRPPCGYKLEIINGKKTPVPNEDFKTMQEIWHLMATGTKSLSEIVKVMNERGLKVKFANREQAITKQSASKTFKNKFYCGYLTSRAHPEWIAKGIHTPMVSEEMFNDVRAIILGKTQLSQAVKRRAYNPEFPLRGLVKCAICNKAFVAGNVRGRHATYPKYWCLNRCIPTIKADVLNEQLNQSLNKINCSPKLIDLIMFRIKVNYNERLAYLNEQRRVAEKDILETKAMMVHLVEGHLKGLYTDDVFKEMKARFEDKLLTSQIVQSDSKMDKYDIDKIINFTKALMVDIPKAFEHSDYTQKRMLIGSIYPEGLLYSQNGLLNRNISPYFNLKQSITHHSVLLGADRFTWIEPFLACFNSLILAYPNYKTQLSYAF